MSASIVRNAVALLLVVTAINAALSFSALMALRNIRDETRHNLQRIEETTAYLSATVGTLCARTSTACPPPPEGR